MMVGVSLPGQIVRQLRALMITWAVAGFLPLPALMTIDPADNAEIACLYLGLASAWFATEVFRHGGMPATRANFTARTATLFVALVVNVALFIVIGVALGVCSNIPFPLMAALSVTPAIGLVPWLTMRVRQPHAALVLGAMICVAAKLAGCVVARIVYGPNYIAEGYVSDDWQTAKLMITLFWSLTVATSLALLIASYYRFRPAPLDQKVTVDF